ncbi:hypothetical protein EU519_00660 [Candidatus Thorarchaeota archaeon]|jgi:predicted RNA binding protein with dsRBD fold (UPF0201 family)|nr:MAG: hypothetical protein EU519_00660 [Candidatus Thorarchaeota archaeon]
MVRIRCPIFPTESPELVRQAVESILGGTDIRQSTNGEKTYMMGSMQGRDNLNLLRQAIHDKRIIDAVRSRLMKNWEVSTSFLRFDKQAAFKGRTRLVDDAAETPPLGSILLEVSFDKSESEFNQFMNWFVPPTQDGRVVKP